MARRKLIVEVIGDSRSLERAFLRSGQAGGKFNTSMSTVGRSIARVGVPIVALAAGITGLGIASVRSAARFEESMQKIIGLSGVAEGKIEGLSDAVLKLGPQVGKGPQELAEALFFITSSGIPAANAMEVLAVTARGAAAGLGETKTVADAVTSVMNAYGSSVVSAGQATDVLVATVREGKGEASDFAGVIGNVVSIASQLGVSFNDVGAALAAMTRLGTDADTSATQLQQVFSSLVGGSQQAEKAFKKVGLSTALLRKTLSEKGLLAGLKQIQAAFKGNIPLIRRAFGDIRAFRGVLALVGNQSQQTAGIFERLSKATGSLDTAFGAISKTTAQQFRRARAAAEVAVIQIGALFAPLAGLVARGLTAATGELNKFLGRIGEAQGIRAKLEVVFEGAADIAKSVTALIGTAVSRIDWDAVWENARGIADGLQKRLEQIDFGVVGRRIGDGFAAAVKFAIPRAKELAARIGDAAAEIDFVKLGKAMGPGLAAAVVTAFVTLLDPAFWAKNWDLALAVAAAVFGKGIGRLAGKLAAPLARFGGSIILGIVGGIERAAPALASVVLNAALLIPRLIARALAPLGGLVARIFGRLGRVAQFVVKVLGIQAAINAVVGFAREVTGVFTRLWNFLKRAAFDAVLAIVEPFSHLPGGFGQWARDAKVAVQKQLDAMGLSAETAAKRVQTAVDVIRESVKLLAGLTAKRRPTGFMDALLGARGGETGAGAGAGAGGGVDSPTPTIKVPTGEPKWIDRWRKAADALQFAVDQASLALDKAGASATLADDIRAMQGITSALAQQEKAIRAQIALHPKNLDLQRQLLDVQRAQVSQEQALVNAVKQRSQNQKDAARQAIKDADALAVKQRKAARKQRDTVDFRKLGLGPTGEQLVPTVKQLRSSLGSISDAVKGTFLDTSKTRGVLAAIRSILARGIGNVSEDIRNTIDRLLDDVNAKLKDGISGPLTKTTALNTKKIAEGLGFSADQIRELRSRLSGFNSAGVAMAGGPGPGGAFGLAPVSAPSSQSNFNFYGDIVTPDSDKFIRDIEKRSMRTSRTRTGTRPGP